MTLGDSFALAALAVALFIFVLQTRDGRRRDVRGARALLDGANRAMLDAWGEWFFSTVYEGDGVARRAENDRAAVTKGTYNQIFLVPTQPFAALLTSSTDDLISARAVRAVNMALYWMGVFNQLVQMQTDFNARYIAEVYSPETSAARRGAIGTAAYAISHMIHGDAIAKANADGGWYHELKDAVAENISALDAELRRRWWTQPWLVLATSFLVAALILSGWKLVDAAAGNPEHGCHRPAASRASNAAAASVRVPSSRCRYRSVM